MTDAFEKEVIALRPLLLRMATARFGRDAEDLVQEALAKALENRASFRPGSNLKAWISRILFNCWLDKLRRDKARPEVPLGERPVASQVPEPLPMWRKVDLELIDNLVAEHLAPELQEVWTLKRRWLKHREIGDMLGIPTNTVSTRVHRAKLQLQSLVERMTSESFDDASVERAIEAVIQPAEQTT